MVVIKNCYSYLFIFIHAINWTNLSIIVFLVSIMNLKFVVCKGASRRRLFCISFVDADVDGGLHIPHNLLHGNARTSRLLNGDIINIINISNVLLMTYCNTLIPRSEQETFVLLCTKPNIDGLARASHFRAVDARYASAALVEMQKGLRLEGLKTACCRILLGIYVF